MPGQPVKQIKIGEQKLIISKNTMIEVNELNRPEMMWQDTDGNGIYDKQTYCFFDGTKKTITLKETNDNKTSIFQEKKIAELKEYEQDSRDFELTKLKVNGQIESFQQSEKTGDCWLLASIHSLSNTTNGRKIIKNSISQKPNGDIEVKLNGVNKTYTFTPKEINNAESRLSQGDDDVRVIELAIEKYRKEIKNIGNEKNMLHRKMTERETLEKQLGDNPLKNPLEGGYSNEFFALFTKNNDLDYFWNADMTENIKIWVKNKYFNKMETMLSKIEKEPDKYAATTTFKEKNDKVTTKHEYSIKSIDKNHIIIINPWDSTKEIKIARKEFLENCSAIHTCNTETK